MSSIVVVLIHNTYSLHTTACDGPTAGGLQTAAAECRVKEVISSEAAAHKGQCHGQAQGGGAEAAAAE